MEYRISDCLDCLEAAGQNLKPRRADTARVRALTLAKLRGERARPAPGRPTRLLAGLIAAAAAALLLCGTAFAAWKLGAFRFGRVLGTESAVLDTYAVSYSQDTEPPIPADAGYADWEKTQLGNYRLVLLELTVRDGALRAVVDLSPVDESLPPFREAGLGLGLGEYETQCALKPLDAWTDRITLTAAVDTMPAEGAELAFVLTGPDTLVQSRGFPVGYSRYTAQDAPAEYTPKLATVADTADYCFRLQTLAVSRQMIYAVVDVEALTAFGRDHLDRCPELAVTNRSNPGSAVLLDPRLVESAEGTRRYLFGALRSRGENMAGDLLGFELLSLLEAGDTAGHPYRLFDVTVEQLVPGEISLLPAEEVPAAGTRWQQVRLDTLGLVLEGTVDRTEAWPPQVVLELRDGTRETVLDEDHRWYGPQAPMPEGHRAVLMDAGGWQDGTDYLCLLFARPLELDRVEAVVVGGRRFVIAP